MKIALLKGRMDRLGGIEKYTLRLANAFHEQGAEVSILTSSKGEIESKCFGRFVNMGPPSRLSHRELDRFDQACTKWLAEHPHPIVFGLDRHRFQTHYRAGNGVHAAYLRQRELVDPFWKTLTYHWNPLHNAILERERSTFENPLSKAIFTNSQMVEEEIRTYYQPDSSRIFVVHNGVEWHEMQKDFDSGPRKKVRLRAQLGLNARDYTFLFVGQGYRRKGLSFLLPALSKLKGKWQLAVVGKDKHTASFRSQCRKLGIDKQVHFYGSRPDVRQFYQMADCLVIPSTYDPFANVTLEALAMGLFVVSSRFNGGCEVLTPDNGDLIEELQDPESVLQPLEAAMATPKTEESATGIRDSVKHLDFSQQLKKIVDITLKTY